jgi:hypothetical protein
MVVSLQGLNEASVLVVKSESPSFDSLMERLLERLESLKTEFDEEFVGEIDAEIED